MEQNYLSKIWEFGKGLFILLRVCLAIAISWVIVVAILKLLLFLIPILLIAFCLILVGFYYVAYLIGDWNG